MGIPRNKAWDVGWAHLPQHEGSLSLHMKTFDTLLSIATAHLLGMGSALFAR